MYAGRIGVMRVAWPLHAGRMCTKRVVWCGSFSSDWSDLTEDRVVDRGSYDNSHASRIWQYAGRTTCHAGRI